MDINIEDLINKRQILFTTKSAFREVDIKQSDTSENTKIIKKMPKIQGNPASLLCLNINSYMGGASDVWKECLGKLFK